MKAIIMFILLCFWTVLSYSQNAIKDAAIAFTSDQTRFSYSPTDLFSNISIATNKFVDGQKGIEFFIISKPRQKPPNIRIDSIILKSSTNKILTVNNPFADTIYYRNNGGLSLTTIQLLDKNELEILKQEFITTIILVVDTKQVLINLRKNSQKKFRDLLNETL
jgi:hypothetical protein